MAPASRLFCFGLGYSAQVLARQLRAQGWAISGTNRAGNTGPDGFRLMAFDGTQPLAADALDDITHLLISIPPDAHGDPVLRMCEAELVSRVGQFAWVGYLSTTGVYGNHDGGVVDETADLRPSPGRSAWRADAEAQWLQLHHEYGLPVHSFRLAGIYGPERNALLTARAGNAKRVYAPGHLFSRIHVDDIAIVLRASIAQPNPGAIYNVCDDEPEESSVVTAYACELAGVALPPLVPQAEAALSPMAKSFYQDRRRVDNSRIKRELGVKLAYPSYREGLRALWAKIQG